MKIKNHNITAIVSDFDGTILRQGMTKPSVELLKMIEMLLEKNILFIAASGRQYANLKNLMCSVAERIGFIAENGSLIIWNNKVLYKGVMEKAIVTELIEDMKKQPDSEILVSGEETCYIVPNTPEYTYKLQHIVKNVVTILNDFQEIKEDVIKVSIYYPKGIPAEMEAAFHKKYDKELLVVESGDGWLDFMAKNSGKGAALKLLSEKVGLDLKQTVAFGDSENDISMFQAVGLSFAMETAREEVKNAADFVCNSVESVLQQALSGNSLEQEQLKYAMQELQNWLIYLVQQAGESKEYADNLWEQMKLSSGVLQEFAYYHDYRKFFCKYQVAGYTIADILVWQVDHFKAYMDRPNEMNRYRQERLLLKAFEIILQMEKEPEFYIKKMREETGTDFEGKY